MHSLAHYSLFRVLSVLSLIVLFGHLCTAASIETDQGVVGYDDTPKLPWCNYIKHDATRPLPRYVDPGPAPTNPVAPPSDAIVLFDGTDFSQWQENKWKIVDGCAQAGKEDLITKQSFGDFQLHMEFIVPEEPGNNFYNRGNSGLYIMGLYELQIFDSHRSHEKQIYPDGQCASIYGDTPPMVNACRKGGQWQTYDILFTAPVFEGKKLIEPAKISVLHNNVWVHNNAVIHAPTGHRKMFYYKPHSAKLPLTLQGHGSAVRFRNIWIRSLSETK